ncbi:MAG: hypothetical protein LBE80_09990 [Deltaproteobacteria bacterium]|jgi:hydroxymethylpyrimidine pyrophosphatase-like HAD family hydrolase|nr:hypothetical protein [Deltaproteobacteria bacterium]
MKVVIFSDLDDTIFQTKNKFDGDKLSPAALGPDGRPLSFMKPAQVFLLEKIIKKGRLIPVTARNRESFQRVQIKFSHGAILNFGGLVLSPSGEVDQKWLDQVKAKALEAEELLNEALAFCHQMVSKYKLKAKARLIGDEGLSFYLVAKTERARLEELFTLKKELESCFSKIANVYLNGNNLSFLPRYLDKGPAVKYFIDTYILTKEEKKDDYIIFGMGDGLVDLNFLLLCDYMIVPTGSQLGNYYVK